MTRSLVSSPTSRFFNKLTQFLNSPRAWRPQCMGSYLAELAHANESSQREISDLKAKVEKLSKLTAAQEERLSVQDSRLSAQEQSVTDRLVAQEQRLAAQEQRMAAQEQRMANQERRAAEQEQRAANHAADHARNLQRAASYSESEYSQQTLADGESSTDDSEDEGLAKYFSSY